MNPQQGLTIKDPAKEADAVSGDAEERVLRAKYLDWCSAQVADEFLALTPDEIFELAERAAQGSGGSVDRSFSLPASASADLSAYRQLVQQVTEVLAAQLDLPGYAEWLDLYRRSPAEVESELLGFWREQVD